MANKKYLKPLPIPLAKQQIRLSSLYGDVIDYIGIERSELLCVMRLQPSENSDVYKVKITYKISDISPKVWLISPHMQMFEGRPPHHVYDKDEQEHYRLCVFDPKQKEWTQQMFLAESFVPWVCTWLNTYEFWLITGEWHYDEAFPRKGKKKGEK